MDSQKEESPRQEQFTSLGGFLENIVNIRRGCDVAGTIDGIKKDIEFKGPNVWILICSIFIASIGLNVNATAAIIGAMLISPLMGPILGIGLAVGTYDWTTLKKSLINLAITVVISLVTSYIYFSLSPLKEIQQELLARTRPTILDVLIAIFGGIAGIVAGSRKEKTNVIPGVAIATALMPPLCTAGFGLATQNWSFFIGAFYLFFINSVFISLSTVLIVRYLHFPFATWVDSKRKARVRMYMACFALLVIVPSGYIFWGVIKESYFKTQAEKFINDQVKFEKSQVVNKVTTYSDTLSTIELFIIGEPVSNADKESLEARLPDYRLDNTIIKVYQSAGGAIEMETMAGKLGQQLRVGIIEDLYKKNEALVQDKNKKIKFLEDQLVALKQRTLPLDQIRKEMNINYSGIQRFAYAETVELDDGGKQDTIPTFLLHWDENMMTNSKAKERQQEEEKLQNWLKVRLELDTIRVVGY